MSKRKSKKAAKESEMNMTPQLGDLTIEESVEIEVSTNESIEIPSEDDMKQVIAELGGEALSEASIFLQEEEAQEGFLPDVSEEALHEASEEEVPADVNLQGTELDSFEAAEIEDIEFVEEEQLESIIESILFASDRPVSLASIQMVFKGTNIKKDKIRRALDRLAVEYAGSRRGVTLEEATGGYQLRTKVDNMNFLRRTVKSRPFKLSGPALEVLAIAAYKQPVVKSEIDSIRGVESGHLLRALMEKGLVNFEGKSELPGRPMQYGTTRKFLEIFGLRNLKELPTLSQIDELLPEGIGDEDGKEKETLSQLTDSLSEKVESVSYSEGEDELMKIQGQLEEINTSSDFFEKEKIRQKMKRDAEKAQNIREAIAMNEEVSTRDINWLRRYDEALAAGESANFEKETAAPSSADEAQATGENEKSDEILSSEESVEEESESDELPFYEDAEGDASL